MWERKMTSFLKKYSYIIVKLFLNQFAIALFGMALALACGKAGNNGLLVVTGIASVIFYLFLQYAVMWEVGAKDGISAVARKTSRGLWRGFVIALCANALNLLLALIILPRAFGVAATASSVAQLIALVLQGMYMGLLAQPVGGAQLNTYVWPYFVIVIPAIVVAGVAYILGSYNLHATNILIPKNPDVKNNGRSE